MISFYEKLSFFSLYLAFSVYNLARVDNSRSKSLSRLIESDLIDWFNSIAWFDFWFDSIAWSEGFFDWSICEESECSLNDERDLLNSDSLNEKDLLNEISSNDTDLEEDFLNLFRKDDFVDKICFSCDTHLKKFWFDW